MNMQYILLAGSVFLMSYFLKEQLKNNGAGRSWVFVGMNILVIIASIIKLLKQ